MAELKPCPFCGGIPKTFCEEIQCLGKVKQHWIYCDNPKCRVQPCTDMHESKSVVVKDWNRRVDNG
jgi:hypothetical protein